MSSHESHVLVETLAWTLIHFVWQGALIALILWLALAALGEVSARVRYLVRCAALACMAFLPLLTFAWLWGEAPPLPVVSASSGTPLAEFPAAALESLWSQPLTWVAVLWSLGALLCVLRFSGGLLQVVRLRRSHVEIDLSPRWQRRFESLARDFGVRVRARVVESSAVCVPAVIGCIKPVVLLPARLFTGLTDAQIEALLAHELAHVARHDYLVNIAQSIVESLLFYHPAVWWVSRGIRVEREYCCDDLAVAATRNGLAYAHALTALESWRGAQPQLGVSTLGGSLMSRIQRLVGLELERPRRAVRPAHAIAGLFVAGTLSASAFAFASLPEPAAYDCKCACHQRAAKAKAREKADIWSTTRAPRVYRRLILDDQWDDEARAAAPRKHKYVVELLGDDGQKARAILEMLEDDEEGGILRDGEASRDPWRNIGQGQDGSAGRRQHVVLSPDDGHGQVIIELDEEELGNLGGDTLLLRAPGGVEVKGVQVRQPELDGTHRKGFRLFFDEEIDMSAEPREVHSSGDEQDTGIWIDVAPHIDHESGTIELETHLLKSGDLQEWTSRTPAGKHEVHVEPRVESRVRFFDSSMNRVHAGQGILAEKNVIVEIPVDESFEPTERHKGLRPRSAIIERGEGDARVRVYDTLLNLKDYRVGGSRANATAPSVAAEDLEAEIDRLRVRIELLKLALEGQGQRGELHRLKAKK